MRGLGLRSVALGLWLGLTAVWPASRIQVGKTLLLWQPFLALTLFVLTLSRARRCGWAAAAAQAFFLYLFFTLAAWLPWLRTIPSTPEFPYPSGYRYYLMLYEAAVASLIGFEAFCAAAGRAPTWWPTGNWARPLAVAPLVLVLRAIAVGYWLGPLVGAVAGAAVAAWQPWNRVSAAAARRAWRLAPWVLCAFAGLVVFAAGMRLYQQLGPAYLLNSDDGPAFYQIAVEIAKDSRRMWSHPPIEANVFSGYYSLMGLWFRVVGRPWIPSWLLWHAAAAGLLALMVFWLGRLCAGPLAGLVAAGLVMADHVLLHLMATLNMETFFIPALCGAMWLWASVGAQPPEARLTRCWWAGLMFGVSVLFRPTSALLPFLLAALLVCERPHLTWRDIRAQGGWMLAGFALPLALLLIRHRLAWGYWTLGGSSSAPAAWSFNYAWTIQGQHPYAIGFGPWLTLLAEDPSVIWREMIPDWWAQMLALWTHHGFGQMDLVQGLNYPGLYQAALASIVAVSVMVGMAKALRRRSRVDLILLAVPAYFTALVFVFLVLNTRYRAPFIPAIYLLCCVGVSAIAAASRSRATEPAISASLAPTASPLPPARMASVP